MTSNYGVPGLFGKIRSLSFQRDWSHIQLKSESTRIDETSRVFRSYPGAALPYLVFGPCIMSEPNRAASMGLSITLTLYYVPPPPH
jgi:hypothetical protein